MTIDDLGPLFDTGSRIGIILATVFVSIRLINSTIESSRTSWQQAAETLTTSADYSHAETKRLRERVAHLEQEAQAYAKDRAAWYMERSQLTTRVAVLEDTVKRVNRQLEIIRDTKEHNP